MSQYSFLEIHMNRYLISYGQKCEELQLYMFIVCLDTWLYELSTSDKWNQLVYVH